MKRYRVLRMHYDLRAGILAIEIENNEDIKAKELLRQNKIDILNGLLNQYGHDSFEEKEKNFRDLGNMPLSILAFHNKFLTDCRNSFVIGSYYPALTGVCALGERILNHLILLLRDDYRQTKEYKKIYDKNSIDDWNLLISVLSSWGILLEDVTSDYIKLSRLRNDALHFKPEIDTNDRTLAIEAILLLQKIIGNQFSAFGNQPWFITKIPGEAYIKKEWEKQPFINKVYSPNCVLVGPQHNLEMLNGKWRVNDIDYNDNEISDDEFSTLRKQQMSSRTKIDEEA